MKALPLLKLTFLKNMCIVFLLLHSAVGLAQDLPAYRIYTPKGKTVGFDKMMKDLVQRDVLLFGELHNNPICHWLQLEVTQAAHEAGRDLVLGAEMFEADDQVVLNEYLQGWIKLDRLEKEAKVWPNFETDYQPLVDFAKENELPFIATNVPRRYASIVAKRGPEALDSLSDEAKTWMGPLPFAVTENDSGYVAMEEMMGGGSGGHGHGMNVRWFVAAQAIKDHTMSSNVLKNLPEGALFIHYNGAFHSQKNSGMCNYLRQGNPDINLGVITSVESDEEALKFEDEWKSLGDYILVIPASMTKTH